MWLDRFNRQIDPRHRVRSAPDPKSTIPPGFLVDFAQCHLPSSADAAHSLNWHGPLFR